MDPKVIDSYGNWMLVFDAERNEFSIDTVRGSIKLEVSETPNKKLQVFASFRSYDWFDSSILKDYIEELTMANEAMERFQSSIDFYSYEYDL